MTFSVASTAVTSPVMAAGRPCLLEGVQAGELCLPVVLDGSAQLTLLGAFDDRIDAAGVLVAHLVSDGLVRQALHPELYGGHRDPADARW